MRFTILVAVTTATIIGFFSIPTHAGDLVIGEPIIVGDELVFPSDVVIPRYMTDAEKKWLETHPHVTSRAVTPPPTGPIHCAAEYEPMDGIVLTWKSFTAIQTIMGKEITTTGGADVYVVCDSAAVQSSANTALTNAGANMSRVKYRIYGTNTVWVRDYGPRYIFEGDCRALTDHDYNRPRPLDDELPANFAALKHHAFYEHQLIHGGGNYHLNSLNKSYATELIWNENPALTHTQIHDIWMNYQNLDTHIFPPFPTSVDLTQHIDMWMQVIADNKVVISDWPNNAGSTQDVICDNAAIYMAGLGYTVFRVPAFSVSGVHYTFTNVVMCNNLVLLPSYTSPTVSPSNATALATWQSAVPGKTVVQVNCQAIIPSAGAMHCIASHVPKHRGAAGGGGGLAPTAYLKNLRGGESLPPAVPVNINWISDDDVSVSNVDILLSTDGGATYDVTIAATTADDWVHSWNPPNIYAPYCRVKIVARDGLGHTGFDASPANFTITGAPVPGDVSCDAHVTMVDLVPFVQALLDVGSFTGCNINAADVNVDTFLDGRDAVLFADLLVP
jgi:agmatine deiminase